MMNIFKDSVSWLQLHRSLRVNTRYSKFVQGAQTREGCVSKQIAPNSAIA